MQKARIKLTSPDFKLLNEICDRILDIAEKTGVKHSGSIPLPTKKLVVPTRKSPCGGGTESYEHWEMRVHKRLIDILDPTPKVIDAMMSLNLPSGVDIEVKM